jgi:hypothetical protein
VYRNSITSLPLTSYHRQRGSLWEVREKSRVPLQAVTSWPSLRFTSAMRTLTACDSHPLLRVNSPSHGRVFGLTAMVSSPRSGWSVGALETLWITASILFIWMQRLSRSLSRLETQDIKTQPQINLLLLDLGQSLMSESNRKRALGKEKKVTA